MSDEKQALTSSGVSVGVNTSEVIQRVLKKWDREIDERELARKKLAEQWQGEVKEKIYVMETRVDKDSDRWRLDSIEQVPQIGIVRAWGTRSGVRAEFRYQMALAWQKARIHKWDEARERAAKFDLVYA